MKYPMLIILGLAYLVLGWHGPAEADFLLSFGSSSYSVGPGRTVQVQVLGSQNSNGTQFGPLTLAEIVVSFNNPIGVAAVTSTANIAGGPLFDISLPGVTSTQATLTNESILGVGGLPVLLGTFTFTGLTSGTTQISVGPMSPGPSFADSQGHTFQPSSATVTLNVTPEPASLLILLTGAPLLLGVVAVRRRRQGASRESRE
jgi:hypothetical protein